MSRFLRCFLCLLLICCILVNLSPLKSKATGIGAVAGLTQAAAVSVPAIWPIVAALAVVGVTAYGIDSGAFQEVANSCLTAISSAGSFIENGHTGILRTVDENGNTQFYVNGNLLEAVRSWVYDSGTVTLAEHYNLPLDIATSDKYMNAMLEQVGSNYKFITFVFPDSFMIYGLPFIDFKSSSDTYNTWNCGSSGVCYNSSQGWWTNYQNYGTISMGVSVPYYYTQGFNPVYESSSSLTLGHLASEDTELDETTVVSFHPYLANVIQTRTSGSGGSGDGEENWWLAVAYAETLEKLYQTSQQAQIEYPSVVEIPDLQEGTQYEVTVEEDEDGNKKYILNPIYNPGGGTDPGGSTDPDPGTNPDPDPDPNPDSGNGSGNNTGTDTGNPGSGGAGSVPSGAPAHFALADLSKFFPFCIPFDLFDFFKLLNADPVAPEFSWTIQDLSGQSYSLTIDLSEWDSVAQLFRRLQLFLFVCGLAAASRKFIKW